MGLLQEMGYTNLRVFPGGMAEWTAGGLPVESGEVRPRTPANSVPAAVAVSASRASGGAAENAPVASRPARPARGPLALIDALAARSVGEILAFWLGMVLVFGLVYFAADALTEHALFSGGHPVPASLNGFLTAMYFSFVTATSVGYGDVIPTGWMRAVAIAEAVLALLTFGFVISKFLSRRQEALVEEIHRIAFEDRLGRVQTNLHMVLSEMQAIATLCADGAVPPARTMARVESAAMVFAQELRTIHDILYRPQQVPEEEVLEGILANLAASFRELADLTGCIPASTPRSATLAGSLRSIERLASEICGECVPREYAPALKGWMDEIQALARGLQPAANGATGAHTRSP